MDLDDDPVRSDEDILVSLSIPVLSDLCFGNAPASESSVTTRMISDNSSSSPLNPEPVHQVNASDGLSSKLPSDHQEVQDIYKETLGPNVDTDISSRSQQSAEDYTISEHSRCNVNPSICATTDDFDAVTGQTARQHMPNCSQSDYQLSDVCDPPTENESSIPSASNAYSGSDLVSEVFDLQSHPVLSSLLGPLSVHWQSTINHTVTDDDLHEPSPEIMAPNEGSVPGGCLQSSITPQMPETQTALRLSLSLESSHVSHNDDSNTTGSGPRLIVDKTLTPLENVGSHNNTPIDFATDHSSTSQIEHTEGHSESYLLRATSPDPDMYIQEDFNSSPPSSPTMTSAFMPSSSPIPTSSPVGLSFQTPPTSPPSSPVKDSELEINDESPIPGNTKSVHVDGGYATIPLLGFANQYIQSMISADVSTQSLTTTKTKGEAVLSKESNVAEQKKLDFGVDAKRLKATNGIPYPKRPTIAANRLQQKKLAQPFRAPAQVPKMEFKHKASATNLRADTTPPVPKECDSQERISSSSLATLDSRIKYRTTRAATQFKSPLSASNALNDTPLVRLTPTIQALERKLQILKRALKVREDVQEEVLEGLVKKWTEAGREVAWEVWNLVKDNGSSDDSSQRRKKRAFEDSWGWESPGDAKKPRDGEMERNWGWDVVPISSRSEKEEEEEDRPKDSLGTMLIQLGVAADAFGWNEEEGTFVDNC